MSSLFAQFIVPYLTSNYSYVPGGYGTGSTSPLVETISQPTGNLIYGYDANGNIVYVSNGSQAVAYAYDAIGQLIRVNDPFDPTAGSSGTTWEYAYDLGGNILSKTAYAFTMGLVGVPVQTVSYAYGDANWKDKLTSYNGVPITYDAIGNPLNDGTWSYTWEHGRQLQSMRRGNEAVSFLYNEDGLRVQKTATSTGTTEYTLHGKNIVHLTRGSDFMHFFYDAQNKPAVVAYNGLLYSYAYNLQGDVIAMLNENGTVVVEYRYDAWGKPISKTGLMADTLGTLNPFRYRGYVYDEESRLYYLQNRYYNPTWCRFVNADVNGGQVSRINSHNTFSYCMNDPACFSDDSGYWASNALQALCGMINKVASVIINSTRELLSTNRILSDKAILNGKVYNLRKPHKGPTISAPPETLAEGHGGIARFSGKQAWINFATHDAETTTPLAIFANAQICIDVDVRISQIGDMEPTACITMSLWRMNANTNMGYHIQEKISSGIWQIYGGNGNSYLMGNADGETRTVVDEDGWIQLALESIEWE